MKTKRANVACEYKAAEDGMTFSGYGSVFGEIDSYGDRVMPGAFIASLAKAAEVGRMPAMLWQHDARQPVGVWTSMREDERGLFVEGTIAETALGRDVYALLKMGAVSGLSIGYSVVTEQRVDGVNELKAVDLWEVSPVTFPANDAARIEAVKAAGVSMTRREFERFLRDAGFSHAQAKAITADGFPEARDERSEQDTEYLRDLAKRWAGNR